MVDAQRTAHKHTLTNRHLICTFCRCVFVIWLSHASVCFLFFFCFVHFFHVIFSMCVFVCLFIFAMTSHVFFSLSIEMRTVVGGAVRCVCFLSNSFTSFSSCFSSALKTFRWKSSDKSLLFFSWCEKLNDKTLFLFSLAFLVRAFCVFMCALIVCRWWFVVFFCWSLWDLLRIAQREINWIEIVVCTLRWFLSQFLLFFLRFGLCTRIIRCFFCI